MPLSGGQKFAGYRIIRLLGSGGMGEVYLAEHPRLPRRNALKVLPSELTADPEYRARFNREADLASKLWHPHIVGVHDRGEHNGQLWIAMDYVDGLDAARLLTSRYPDGMPTDRALRIVTAVASALDYAHRQGLLHRDVKPANIMLTHLDDDEDEQRVLLTDFGIARNVDDISGLTATNMTVGTSAYSAPEQLMGEEMDGRTDQYALAATTYHLLTGVKLFPHSNPAVVISRHLNAAPTAMAQSRPELADFDPVLAVALSKDPNERFPRCSDFARALNERSPRALSSADPTAPASHPLMGAVVTPSATTDTGAPRAPATSPRRWLLAVAVATAVVFVGALTLIWRPWHGQPNSPAATTTALHTPDAAITGNPPGGARPASPPANTFSAKAIDGILLTADEVNGILGTFGKSGDNRIGVMKIDRSTYGMADNSSLVKPSNCVGVVFGAEHLVYADTGFDTIRDQTFTPEPYVYAAAGSPPLSLEQTAIVFASADQAQAVLASAQNQWRSCASSEVDQKAGPESGYTWNLGTVQRQGALLTVKMASNGAMTGAAACQQVLGLRANVIVGTRSCNDLGQSAPGYDTVRNVWPTNPGWATNDAANLANAMLDKVQL